MIVDDNPANLKLLEDMLRRQGYEVRSFPRGRLALAAAEQEPPDLILLDIDMPEMNGYEVCERLKSTAELSGIPVIFLSALNETQDKVKALQSGAVDYISKPFQFEEVHARVETHLKLHDLQRALKLPSAALPKFFDLFSIGETSTPGGYLGLGPAVAYRILSLFGASVTVVNRDPSGIRRTISLKNAAPARADSRTV